MVAFQPDQPVRDDKPQRSGDRGVGEERAEEQTGVPAGIIVGIIALGVTQVIISGGIDLSSGSIVGATAMIAMSFAQTAMVNGNPNPKAIFGDWAMDLPVIVPVLVGLGCGMVAGFVNGVFLMFVAVSIVLEGLERLQAPTEP